MKGIKYRLNIDKLTLCYMAQRDIVDDLENTKEWIYQTLLKKKHIKNMQ